MRVYLDHNSTTPMRVEARERWLEVLEATGGNPSSPHLSGRRARAWIDDARARSAGALGVAEDEIFFTSGATEANNLALFGALEAQGERAGLVTTAVEHSSVLGPAAELAARGRPVVRVGVDSTGLPDPEEIASAASRPDVRLASVTAANNETGALPDLLALGEALARLGTGRPLLHTDAAQALGRIPLRLGEWGADLASFSAHKFGGPPGIGILWRRRSVALRPRAFGGGQELDLRPGTENTPGIAATALAVELAVREQESYSRRVGALARELWSTLAEGFPALRLLGPPLESDRRLPNTLCVLVPGTAGQVLVTRLDLAGLEVSAGSACASGSIEPSHVLLAMGLTRDEARAGVRISLGRSTTREECKGAVAAFHNAFATSRTT